MKLSKQEYKYRYKLFYENHYDKSKQQDIDYHVQHHNITYKALYYKESLPDMFMMYPTNSKRLSKALYKLGILMKDVKNSFRNTYDILNDVANKWSEAGELNK